MKEEVSLFIRNIKTGQISFKEVIEFIETHYIHQPTAFRNGNASNEASQNQGSAKVFSFARLNDLTEEETLLLFCEHYRSVVESPEKDDHQNIRQFMQSGWEGIHFEGEALKAK